MYVKSLLFSSPVHTAPDFEKPFKLEVDANAVGPGAVLIQEGSKGLDHPVDISLGSSLSKSLSTSLSNRRR